MNINATMEVTGEVTSVKGDFVEMQVEACSAQTVPFKVVLTGSTISADVVGATITASGTVEKRKSTGKLVLVVESWDIEEEAPMPFTMFGKQYRVCGDDSVEVADEAGVFHEVYDFSYRRRVDPYLPNHTLEVSLMSTEGCGEGKTLQDAANALERALLETLKSVADFCGYDVEE